MRKSTRYGPTYDRGPRISADLDDVRSSRGLAACGTSPAQVGYIRLGPLIVPNSGKPEFGWGRSDRACAIRVRGADSMTVCDPLTRNARAQHAHSDLSPAGRGKP